MKIQFLWEASTFPICYTEIRNQLSNMIGWNLKLYQNDKISCSSGDHL